MGQEESNFICAVCHVYAEYLTIKLTDFLLNKKLKME